jgi:hypothetical protein
MVSRHSHAMTLHSSDVRSPAELIGQVAEQVPLFEDSVYVVLVARPSTDQRIVAVHRMMTPAVVNDWQEASDEIYDVMQQLPIPPHPAPVDHTAVTVLVRAGLCVFGPNEGLWMSAWRYSNHLTNAFDGRMILVTEHGWTDFMTDTAGYSPAMVA